MMEQAAIIDGLRDERVRLVSWLGPLPAASWDVESLCAGWRVRDVVAHLVGICADVLNQNMDGIGTAAYNAKHVDDRKDRTPEELLAEWGEAGPAVEAIYAAMPPELWEVDIGGVIGTIGNGVLRQLEDLWVHAQDIRVPLGADPSAGPGLTGTLDLVALELPHALDGASVGALDLHLAGFERTVTVGTGPTVRIEGDPVSFALVATGRSLLSAAQADGKLLCVPDLPELQRSLNVYGESFEARASRPS